jgi:hypothetical protein
MSLLSTRSIQGFKAPLAIFMKNQEGTEVESGYMARNIEELLGLKVDCSDSRNAMMTPAEFQSKPSGLWLTLVL